MDNSVYLGVRIPDVPYQRIAFNDINLEHSLGDSGLRERAASQFNLPGDEIGELYFSLFMIRRRFLYTHPISFVSQCSSTRAVLLRQTPTCTRKGFERELRFM